MKYTRPSQKGQTVIEVLVGLAAAVAVLSAITTTTLSSLHNSQFGRNQNLADTYAQQGMEIIKNLHDTDYGTFSNLSGTYCFAQTCHTIDTNPANVGEACAKISGTRCPGIFNAGEFIRTVTFHAGDAEAAKCNATGSTVNTKVDVSLSWNDEKCIDPSNLYCHSVIHSSCFNDASIVPTP